MTLDAAFVKSLVEDYENAPLSKADRAMLDYVTQLFNGTKWIADVFKYFREKYKIIFSGYGTQGLTYEGYLRK